MKICALGKKRPPVTPPSVLQYDPGWILNGLAKHRALYSMVLWFDSNDPERLKQLKRFFASSPEGYEYHTIYVYNPWDGLGKYDKDKNRIEPVSPGDGQLPKKEKLKIQDLAGCLQLMDEKLKNDRTILILYGLNKEQSGKDALLAALKAWAGSAELMEKLSLVILFGSVFFAILDDETRDLVATIDVPIGMDSEYQELVTYLSKMNGIPSSNAVVKAIQGLNLHQAHTVLVESCYKTNRTTFDLEQIKRSKSELVKKAAILEIEDPREGFEAIGGYQAVKDFVQKKIVDVLISKSEKAQILGVSPPRGILLFGPPGTGKTLFAKALAKAVQLPFLNMKTENIYRTWLGESGQRMRNAIKIAEQMSPAIVFIDEIDRFGQRTTTTDSAGEETRRVFSQLLEWLGDKDRKAIIVGTTNVPEQLDDAFIRTGRFDYKIPIGYPDADARLAILRIHLGLPDEAGKPSPQPRPPLDPPNDEEFIKFLGEQIVPKTELYTGAELAELVNRAKRIAFELDKQAVSQDDLVQSLNSFHIDLEGRNEQKRKFEEYVKKYTDDTTFLSTL
ncbi:MAG: ATP-binding protein [Thermoproteota archaeon]